MKKNPNFLFIITDQHRADHLGCYGNSTVRTPAIDSIAQRGCRFERFYVANPICMSNRASIMTGRMPSLHGVRHNGIALSRDHTTYVELLRDAGYRTALIGKSHLQNFTGLPAIKQFQPDERLHVPSAELRDAVKDGRTGPAYDLENTRRWSRPLRERLEGHFYGFDHFDIVADHADQASGDYLIWARQQEKEFDSLVGPENASPDNRYQTPQAWRTRVPEELYSTRYIEDRSCEFLETQAAQQGKQPFFLQMSFPDPHHPFTPPGKYWGLYDPQDIALPASFGQGNIPPVMAMRKALEDGSDPRDNQSPFAVTADEARAAIALTYAMIAMIDDAIARTLKLLAELGLADDTVVIFTTDHGDFMGDHGLLLKRLLHFQGLIRVPFIWVEPDGASATTNDELSSSIDIPATILARAGIQPFNGIQGRDLFSTEAPDVIIVEEDSQRLMTGFDRLQRVRTAVTRNWRMTLRQGEDWDELYDLRNDPHETQNRFDDASLGDIKADLMEGMLRRSIELQDHAPLPSSRA